MATASRSLISNLTACPSVAVALFCTLACGGCARPASPPRAASPPGLVGAWRSRVQFTGGAFAPIKDLQFLYAFNAGGTMTESSNYDGVPPVPPAYGVWREVSPNQFEAKYVFFTTRSPATFKEISSGGGWLPSGHGVLTEHIQLGGDGRTFESTITFEAFDRADSSAVGGGQAKGHGVRIDF